MDKKLKKIVVAMDNSPYAMTALQWGIQFALPSKCAMTLVHVMEIHYMNTPMIADLSSALGVAPIEHAFDSYRTILKERGKNTLAAGEELCRQAGIIPERVMTEGIVYQEIKDFTEDADLLVLGRRGEHSTYGMHLFGGEGERTVRRVGCSCLIVPERFVMPERLVIGINQSPPSHAALGWAMFLQKHHPEMQLLPIHIEKTNEEKFSLPDYPEVTIQSENGNPEEILLKHCQVDAEKTLCLLGATSHHPTIMELILGTIPFHLLHKHTGPLLIAR